jgi:uncharacterized protein
LGGNQGGSLRTAARLIAIDTNILIYAHRPDARWHDAARTRIASLAESQAPWAIPWPCLHEFIAIVTHAKVYAPPTPVGEAFAQIGYWRESPSLVLIGETPRHMQVLERISLQARTAGPEIHDAKIAAICMQHAVSVLWSADRDFLKFKDLTIVNPLVA